MNPAKHFVPLTVLLMAGFACKSFAEDPLAIMGKVVEKIKVQTAMDDNYGFHQRVRLRKLAEDSQTVQDEELRLYRTVWIQGKPFNQLIKKNGQVLDASDRAKESKRKSDFLKEQQGTADKSGSCLEQEVKKIRWWYIYTRYDYTFEPLETGATYVISFIPKAENFSTETRIEKILKEVRGKLWIDKDFNIFKAEASLQRSVDFGFGLIAKIDKMHTKFTQQKFHEMWVPASLRTTFQARIALVHNERKELQVDWFEPFVRSSPPTTFAAGL
jgi:hypothetical protein